MNSEKSVSCTAAPGIVVEINGFGSRKKGQIEKCLREQILQLYGESGETIFMNPLFRIFAKFEALSRDAQLELYGFARGRLRVTGEGESLKDRLWRILEQGFSVDRFGADVEEFADTLLIKEKTYKRVGESLDLCLNSLPIGKGDKHNAISIN